MTPSTKPTTRLSSAYVRERGRLRQLVVTVHGSLLELRPKGMRCRETLDLAGLYVHAIRSRLAREKFERQKARKAKRGTR